MQTIIPSEKSQACLHYILQVPPVVLLIAYFNNIVDGVFFKRGLSQIQ